MPDQNMSEQHNHMVHPYYIEITEQPTKIELTGNVLIFGSGDMIHEHIFFDFSKCTKVVMYEPYPKPNGQTQSSPGISLNIQERISTKFEDINGSFDSVIVLFSLHYERCWILALKHIYNQLKVNGKIYFAEDRGFRALLDNNFKYATNFSQNEEHTRIFRKIFKTRDASESVPWYPGISASSYALVFDILSLVAEQENINCQMMATRNFTAEELSQYLPWQINICSDIDHIISQVKEEIMENTESITVKEAIKLSVFTKIKAIPDIYDLTNYTSKIIWDIIAYRASKNISKTLIPIQQRYLSRENEMSTHYVHSLLGVAYFNIFRHFKVVLYAEVILGLLGVIPGSLVKDDNKKQLDKDPIIANFSSNGNNTISNSNLKINFEIPEPIRQYIDNIKSGKSNNNFKYAGEYLRDEMTQTKRFATNIFLWLNGDCSDDIQNVTCINEGTSENLYDNFKRLDVPKCLYVLEPIAYDFEDTFSFLTSASVIYLCSEYIANNTDYAKELSSLVYLTRGMMPILAGRSAFLEMWLAKREGKISEVTKDIFKQFKKTDVEYSALKNLVNTLSSFLDPEYLSYGDLQLDKICERADEYFNGGTYEHESTKYIKTIENEPNIDAFLQNFIYRHTSGENLQGLVNSFTSELTKSQRWDESIVNNLFADKWADLKNAKEFESIMIGKALSKNDIPGSWIYLFINTGKYNCIVSKEEYTKRKLHLDNPNSSKNLEFLVVLQTILRLPRIEIKSDSIELNFLTIKILIKDDGRGEGDNGLQKLKDCIDNNNSDGNTVKFLKLFQSLITMPEQSPKSVMTGNIINHALEIDLIIPNFGIYS